MSFQITEETYKEYNFENVIWWEHAPSSSCHFRNIFFIQRVIEENIFFDYLTTKLNLLKTDSDILNQFNTHFIKEIGTS